MAAWRSASGRPYAVALAKGRGFSTDQYGGTVSVFDLATLQPVTRISVGDYPEGIETSADGNSVYVVNWFSNEVWAINTEMLAVTVKMPAPITTATPNTTRSHQVNSLRSRVSASSVSAIDCSTDFVRHRFAIRPPFPDVLPIRSLP